MGSRISVDVWLGDTSVHHVDGVGRATGWPSSALIAATEVVCPRGEGRCRPSRLADGRSRCPDCGAWWSASQVARHAGVARADQSVGIDVEDRRRRPAAFRRASGWCGVRIEAAEQWTQAEAWWKAAGLGSRAPRAGEIPLADSWVEGWQATRDRRWWLHTSSTPFPWSLALPSEDDGAPPELSCHDLDFDHRGHPLDSFDGPGESNGLPAPVLQISEEGF
ncbi:MAG: hypothetical protein LBS56_03750 [Propionibacteriaceae bacterium]|jgi:hypothetical protein|nr:hypothetical protein [Propionibacteriaceae bacterium]